MRSRVLVTYASKHGATGEIAQRIGTVLDRHRVAFDVLPVELVTDFDRYSAVVLGIAVYMGRWRRDAVRFLDEYEKDLASRPFWLFSSGPSGAGDPEELLHGWKVPASQTAAIARIHPRSTVVFHGSLDPQKLSGFEKWIINRVKAETGDFRDWNTIETWAQSIAESS